MSDGANKDSIYFPEDDIPSAIAIEEKEILNKSQSFLHILLSVSLSPSLCDKCVISFVLCTHYTQTHVYKLYE